MGLFDVGGISFPKSNSMTGSFAECPKNVDTLNPPSQNVQNPVSPRRLDNGLTSGRSLASPEREILKAEASC